MASSDKSIDYQVNANADGFVGEMQRVGQAAKQTHAQVASSFEAMTGSIKTVMTALGALTAILAGGAAFKSAINSTTQWTGEVSKLAKTMGITTEQASDLNVALRLTGQSADSFTEAGMKLLQQVKKSGDAVEAMGLRTKDADGHLRPMMDLMGDGAKLLLEYKEGVDRDAAAMYLFGKGASDAMAIMKLNEQVMTRARQLADDYGLKIGKDNVAAAKAFKQEQAAVGLLMDSLQLKIGTALMPVLTQLAGWFNNIGPTVVGVFASALKTVISLGEAAVAAFRSLVIVAAAIFSGDIFKTGGFDRMKAAINEVMDEADARVKKLWADMPAPAALPGNEPKGGNRRFVAPKEEKEEKEDKSRVSEWDLVLQQQKAVFEAESGMRELGKEAEIKYWQEVLQAQQVTSTERIQIERKIVDARLALIKEQRTRETALAQEAITEEQRVKLDGLELERKEAEHRQQLGQISKEQLLMQEKKFEDRKLEIQQEALQARLALLAKDPTTNAVAMQQLQDQILDLQRATYARKRELDMQAETVTESVWKQAFNSIQSGFASTIRGLVSGTMTITQAFRNMLKSVLDAVVNFLIQYVAKQIWASATTTATKATEATAVVGSNAAEAASGAAASASSIPFAGWALAAVAFAAVMAMVLGARSQIKSAAGGFDIPRGLAPMTQLHPEEMVLPAEHANTIRRMAGGAGGQGSGGSLEVSIKGAPAGDFFMVHKKDLVAALKSAHRDFQV